MTGPVPGPVTVREERPGDEAGVRHVVTEAFAGMPYAEGDEAELIPALRRAGALTLSLVAVADGVLVGQAAFSPAREADGAPGWFALGPVAVVPRLQGRGIGSLLIRDGLARLAADGAAGCILVGDADYYARFGFVPAPELSPPGQPADHFMVKVLAGPPPRAPVAFHAAFGPGAA